MTTYSTIRDEVLDEVARITRNRPERRNALDRDLHDELSQAVVAVRDRAVAPGLRLARRRPA